MLYPLGINGNLSSLGIAPGLVILFFVECPPTFTIELFAPNLVAAFNTPSLAADHLTPDLDIASLEPGLLAEFLTPDLETEVCP